MAEKELLHPGDMVQVKRGAIDITNGGKAGTYYTPGSSMWGTIELIVPQKAAAGPHKGLTVDKVRILGTDGKTVVFQVVPDDVDDNIRHMNDCEPKPYEPEPEPYVPPVTVIEEPTPPPNPPLPPPEPNPTAPIQRGLFVTHPEAETWRPTAGDPKQSRGVIELEKSRPVITPMEKLSGGDRFGTKAQNYTIPVRVTPASILSDEARFGKL